MRPKLKVRLNRNQHSLSRPQIQMLSLVNPTTSAHREEGEREKEEGGDKGIMELHDEARVKMKILKDRTHGLSRELAV